MRPTQRKETPLLSHNLYVYRIASQSGMREKKSWATRGGKGDSERKWIKPSSELITEGVRGKDLVGVGRSLRIFAAYCWQLPASGWGGGITLNGGGAWSREFLEFHKARSPKSQNLAWGEHGMLKGRPEFIRHRKALVKLRGNIIHCADLAGKTIRGRLV